MKQNSWTTLGNDAVKSLLDRQLGTDALSHAYLFVGPRGGGKEALAREFAAKILQTEKLVNHPDFLNFEIVTDTAVEAVRNAISQLSVRPFIASRKAAIFKNVDQLNRFGANALLKTLEEPTTSTILILTSDSPNILPTIVSRCLKLNFGTSPHALDQASTKHGERLKILEGLLAQSYAERILAISQFSELEQEELETLLLEWAFRQRRQLSHQPKRYMLIRNIFQAVDSLRAAGNKKMVLQQLFLHMNLDA